MTRSNFEICVKGRRLRVPALDVAGYPIIVKGKFVRIASLFDEYWLEKRFLPDPIAMVEQIESQPRKPDLFTFAERVPQTAPRYGFPIEWENYAVMQLQSYDEWLGQGITSSARRNVAASVKRGVTVRVSSFDEAYIRGIMAIYNESPIRQGRRFWHYGKDYADVRDENGTYSDRSTYLAAYFQDQMIGYCKVVWDEDCAAIMQLLSMINHYDKRPNNALIAAAVRECCSRRIHYLVYEHFIYGNNVNSSLTKFKRANGFFRMDVPRYLVPLTRKGRLALWIGLHRNPKDRLPPGLRSWLVEVRSKWHRAVGVRKRNGGRNTPVC